MAVGHRLPERTRSVVTDCLGLVTLLVAGLSASASPTRRCARRRAGRAGAHRARLAARSAASPARCCGSRTAWRGSPARSRPGWRGADWSRPRRAARAHAARERFIEGWLTRVPAVLRRPADHPRLALRRPRARHRAARAEVGARRVRRHGLRVDVRGRGPALGGVGAVVQGALTVVGVLLGSVLPDAHIAALTATGGLMLGGIGLRLLRIRDDPGGRHAAGAGRGARLAHPARRCWLALSAPVGSASGLRPSRR